jgi:RHS repeat-associated protein
VSSAAKQSELAPELLPLAARSRLSEEPHQGHQLPTAALHPGIGFAISYTATELRDPLYDFRGGPLRSGYFRDAETGLDYAMNRFHNPGTGRFMTPDPYMNSAGPTDPGSWNRYAYTRGDPVNRHDPIGSDDCPPGVDFCVTTTASAPAPLPWNFSDDDDAARYGPGPYVLGTVSEAVNTAILLLALSAEQQQFKQAQTAFQNAANFIADANSWSQDCENDFKALGTSDAAVEAGASAAQFYDGIGSSVTIASLYAGAANPDVQRNGALLQGTVGQNIGSSPLGVVADAQLGGNAIYLNGPLISGLMNGTYKLQNGAAFNVSAVALHEILHNVTGLTDPEIQSRLNLSTTSASDNIAQKLLADCFPQ